MQSGFLVPGFKDALSEKRWLSRLEGAEEFIYFTIS
jgi:hypothetical protein